MSHDEPAGGAGDQALTALVTGGGTGIGRAIARRLAADGVDCVIVGRRRDVLEAAAEELRGLKGRVEAVTADVADEMDRQAVIDECARRFGDVDILINNAGTYTVRPLFEEDEPSWRHVLAVNLEAPFFLAQLVLPGMRAKGWGRIVNIGSVYGALGMNAEPYGFEEGMAAETDAGPLRQPSYHASKSGIVGLSRDLAVAVARWGVTVNTVVPGMIKLRADGDDGESPTHRHLAAMTPVRRLGTPEEVAYAVRFLASREAAFITGTELVVDGGWSAW